MAEEKLERFSFSKVNTYDQCHMKYKIQYVDGHYAYTDSIATKFGTALHEAEETIAKCIRDKIAIDYTKIKNDYLLKVFALEKKFKNDFSVPDKTGRTYLEKAFQYVNQDIYKLEQFMKEHQTYEIVGIEQKFNLQFGEKLFTGAIDRIFHDTATDEYIIQDIKSWNEPEDENELKTPLQFVIYCLAAKEIYNLDLEKTKCQYYVPFCLNMDTLEAGTKGFISRGQVKLDKLFTSIDAGDWKPTRSPLCNWCAFSRTNPDAKSEFKYLCPYYSLWERTTRNKFDISKGDYEWQGIENHAAILEEYTRQVKGGE